MRWLKISPDETAIAAYAQIVPKLTEVPEEPVRFVFSPRASIAIGETGFRLLGCVTRRAWIGRVSIRHCGIIRRDCKAVSQKSKLHIRGMLSILWDYAMWRGDVPTQRNPMELVRIKGANQRLRKPRSLTAEEFHALMEALGEDVRSRTMLLLAVSFGLRISEVLGLKWKDIDWLAKTIRIERAVVKQIVDDVKSSYSAGTMLIADALLESINQWKQTTHFSGAEDWKFASAVKLGRQPLSYTHVWGTLDRTAKKAPIGHVSSHTFRHTYRTWLDSVGTPVGVQQKLMRHSDIRTTMNIYGDAVTDDLRTASHKVARIALAVT